MPAYTSDGRAKFGWLNRLKNWLSWPRRDRSHRGRDQRHYPDFRYQPIAEPEEVGNGGRIQWVSSRPGQAPAYAGTDFVISRDGQIAAVYLFFDKLP
jgi:hypothetical protein